MADLLVSEAAKKAVETKKLAALKVEDLMHRNVKVGREDDSLRDVYGLMKMGGFRHVPIIDEDDKLMGIVTDRDIHLAWSQGQDTKVSSFMRRSIEFIHPDANAREAAARMIKGRFGCLPVVDDDRKVIGIITDTDFLLVAHRALTIQRFLAEE